MSSMNSNARQGWIAVRLIIVGIVVFGVLYPLAVAGVGRVFAQNQAGGSLLERNGVVVGSSLVGQNFSGDRWFQPRPSAAGSDGYDALSSGGSNLGPNSDQLLSEVGERRSGVQQQDGATGVVPPDALTASGSGLDPHISPEYAQLQIPRVARSNGLADSEVAALIAANTSGRQFGFLGEERVNVLALNLAVENIGRRR